MEVIKNVCGTECVLNVKGRLDTNTAPSLEAEITAVKDSIESLVLDFEGLEYISSAGLRVLLSTQKVMATKGGMKIKNVCEDILEVFEITGFSDILTVE